MIDALSEEEGRYFASEENVVDYAGKSNEIFKELESHYGFVGGDLTQYTRYFHRKDLPQRMWKWVHTKDVKAVAGFSVVGKKRH